MKTVEHNKLVRDLIPDIIVNNNAIPTVRIADKEEYWLMLRAKLGEEVAEFLESEEVEELADILEVIRSLCSAKGVSFEDVESMRMSKELTRGGFEKRIILEKTEE